MKYFWLLTALCLPLFSLSQPLLHEIPPGCQSLSSQQLLRKASFTSLPAGYSVPKIIIRVDSIDFTGHQLRASADIRIAATSSVSSVSLDLLGFTVDSVTGAGGLLVHAYNDTVLTVTLGSALNAGDSTWISVFYQGQPAQDASGWGGFYFSGSYAFNLGVGFAADPHNYGRAWYPCIDDFTTRSQYEFFITTPPNLKAFCNGTLQQQTVNPNGTVTWHWRIDQTIPSYLTSVAVGAYHTLERTSNGIPVQWAALPSDTPAVLSTFSTLDTTLSRFINAYGAYPFDKVGYCLVPFNSGAMEHASSIHIGRAFINGTQTYATLWAHELSHMWWGDKVTCSSAEDMWLNEGFASYNEYYYTQFISGQAAYQNAIRSNHRKQLQFAHTPAGDGSYFAMNNIPHAYTYGNHVYNKGADMVHTLRNYMGDQGFFAGCQTYMSNLAYNSASSADFRDQLTLGSGINMNRFFDDWIFTPGWPHFSIDSVVYQPGGLDHYWVYTRQRSVGNNHLYAMPVDITFSDGVIDTTVSVVIDSVTNVFHIPIYFLARWITLDLNERVSDAIADNIKIVTTTGIQAINETNVTLNVQSVSVPSSVVRAEHNFVPPDPFKQSNPGIRLSDYHYWKIEGLFEPGFLSKGTFVYDGSTNGSTGYLDNTFITTTEDSLVILYREGTWDDWQPVNGITHNIGPSSTDKRGSFTVDTLKQGEYTYGIYDYTVGIQPSLNPASQGLNVYPNPSGDTFRIVIPSDAHGQGYLTVYDNGGRVVKRFDDCRPGEVVIWDPQRLSQGIYLLRLEGEKVPTLTQKLIYTR